ncbi:putative zinc finger CCCH domain-containing protein 21 [Elaeis guineensis]|uniref:Zinc finger CCCH domain-containing protein 21 n=1 Tax=Elaeis guineensis var. tenera TaxID=51953 RepID=A0A6I9S784_ELAGV|nr:putative zinc finger CCCH domain-containing protein 21 [Elaeis guineensis]
MEGEITLPASQNSVAGTHTSCCSFEDGDESTGESAGWISGDRFEIQKHQILRELQQMVNRYNDCFRQLQAALSDLDVLRHDNLQLNADHLHLTFLLEEMEASAAAAATAAGRESVPPEAQGKQKIVGGETATEDPDPDPAPPGGSDGGGGKGGTRGGLPKSISIRSRGFLAVKQPPAGGDVEARRPHRLRLPASAALKGEEGDGEVEVEAYSQGMAKTELCNKWVEKGWCPYGERCQFAHGIQELRPVIRHPRYKTQLCRMLASGGDCPYGHRCHFRHALPSHRDA